MSVKSGTGPQTYGKMILGIFFMATIASTNDCFPFFWITDATGSFETTLSQNQSLIFEYIEIQV